jgi:hypothetical protein
MKIKEILPILISMAVLSACSAKEEMPDFSQSVSEPVTETILETQENISLEAAGKSRIPADESEKELINLDAVTYFLEAVKNQDAATVAMYSNSTPQAVQTWISSAQIESYELGGCYKENYTDGAGYEYYTYYVLVKINVSNGENNVFHSGEGLYRFYASSAISSIGEISADEKVMDMQEKRVSYVCERYEALLGWDFDKGNASKLYDMEYVWFKLREFGYVNHREIDSLSALNDALYDNLGLENIPWDYSVLAIDDTGNRQIYEKAPRDGSWRFFGVKELTQEKCVVEYYADIFGFAVAKTVEYTYVVNENNTICITSVNTISETGLEEAVGSI